MRTLACERRRLIVGGESTVSTDESSGIEESFGESCEHGNGHVQSHNTLLQNLFVRPSATVRRLLASRADKARRVNARYPRTDRAEGQNFRRISSSMRLKTRFRQFWRRGQAGSRKKGEITDREWHRGNLVRKLGVGKDRDC